MSEFFTHLAGRALRPSDEVQPQIRSRFERGETVRQPGKSNDFEEGEEGAISLIAPRERTPIRAAAPDELAGRIEGLEAILPPPVKAAVEPAPLTTRSVGESSPSELESEVFVERVALRASPPLEKVGLFGNVADDEGRSQHAVNYAPRAPAPTTTPVRTPPRESTEARRDPIGIAPFRDEPQIVPIAPSPVSSPRASQKLASNFADPPHGPDRRVVQITIGRLEIRASAAVPPTRQTASRQGLRAMTLDEFLHKRAAGGSR
jgi:hypothetical protein